MLKIGILGAGNMADKMSFTLSQMQTATCYAIASRTLEKGEKFAEKWKIPKVYRSYEELTQDPDIDLIYIATPHSHHYEHIKLCLEHNKNVLCEKSFTINRTQAEELFSLADEKRLFLSEAMWTRYLPIYQTLCNVLESGMIGNPQLIIANICYPIHMVPRMIRPSLAGGTLLDIGVYALNFAAMVFPENPASISGYATLTKRGVDVQDSITLIWKDGKMASLQASMMGPSNNLGTIIGTSGFIEIANIINPKELRIYNKEMVLIEHYLPPKQLTGYEYEIESCRKSIEQGLLESPEMSHLETLRILNWMDTLRSQFGVIYPME